jgi:hypothetical protein
MQTQAEKVAALKQWCENNYSNGADTMVECWETKEYEELLQRCNNDYATALEVLQRLASVYRDQQADAEYHRSQA